MTRSLMSKDKTCYLCGTPLNLHKHHIYGGANRKLSEKWGCWCWLCERHHNMSNAGIHFDKDLDDEIKEVCQILWEKKNGTEEDFRAVFGKSYKRGKI